MNDLKDKGINLRVDMPILELTVFHRSVTENDANDAKKGLRKSKFSHLINQYWVILILIQSKTSLKHLHTLQTIISIYL